jgi:formylglycine-generating enzyme required for sulfatase activity
VTGSCEGGTCNDAGAADGTIADANADAQSPCPTGKGPEMALIHSALGTFCIDTTEVTASQYAEFVAAKNGDTSGQPSYCAWNASYDPVVHEVMQPAQPCPTYDPTGKPDLPVVCVNWCQAYAYCAWAGKRLCGKIGGGPLDPSEFAPSPISTSQSEWFAACTSGSKYLYVYDSQTYRSGVCVDSKYTSTPGLQPVGAASGCRPTDAPVFDLLGNAAEWIDICSGGGDAGTSCATAGGSFYLPSGFSCAGDRAPHADEGPRYVSHDGVGIRCCADGN